MSKKWVFYEFECLKVTDHSNLEFKLEINTFLDEVTNDGFTNKENQINSQ